MAFGFQVFNADGTLQFDTSNRLFRPVASFTTTAGNGSKTIAGISSAGDLVPMCVGTAGSAKPTITISGDTITWTFDSATNWPGYGPVATSVILFSR